MAHQGTCLCGAVKVAYDGDLKGQSLCHCGDCKKITGATYSTNFLVPDANFKLTSGTPKEFKKTADSGQKMVSFFCQDCGTTLWRETTSFPGIKVIKAGILDGDELDNAKWGAELFAPRRTKWVPQVEGAAQVPAMPS